MVQRDDWSYCSLVAVVHVSLSFTKIGYPIFCSHCGHGTAVTLTLASPDVILQVTVQCGLLQWSLHLWVTERCPRIWDRVTVCKHLYCYDESQHCSKKIHRFDRLILTRATFVQQVRSAAKSKFQGKHQRIFAMGSVSSGAQPVRLSKPMSWNCCQRASVMSGAHPGAVPKWERPIRWTSGTRRKSSPIARKGNGSTRGATAAEIP